MSTWVIVNDRGEYFAWIHAGVDEFDNITHRGVTWTADWQTARVFYTRRTAERNLARVRMYGLLCQAAIAPP